MKIFLAVFACFVVANCSPIQTSEQDFRTIANDLVKKTADLSTALDGIKHNIETAPEVLNKTVYPSDYGVSKNPQIIKLEEELEHQRSKKNVTACKKLLDDDKLGMKQIFDFVFWLGVNSILEEDTDSVNQIRNTLQAISTNLQGTKLDEEIKFCMEKPEQCKLTTEYSKKIDDSQKSIDELKKIPKSVLDSVLNEDFDKQVSEKINEEVYPPVTECIKKLKA